MKFRGWVRYTETSIVTENVISLLGFCWVLSWFSTANWQKKLPAYRFMAILAGGGHIQVGHIFVFCLKRIPANWGITARYSTSDLRQIIPHQFEVACPKKRGCNSKGGKKFWSDFSTIHNKKQRWKTQKFGRTVSQEYWAWSRTRASEVVLRIVLTTDQDSYY